MAPLSTKAATVGSDTTLMVSGNGAIKGWEFSAGSTVGAIDFKPTCSGQVSVNSKYAAARRISKFALR